MGARVSLSASTRVRGMQWEGETTAVSSWQNRSWKSWRGLWMASSDSWCQSRIPRQRHNRCNLCCQAAAREVSSCQQETLHGFRRPGEGIWSSASECHLVGAEKTWCRGVDCPTGVGDVCPCTELCPCWGGVQWRVWSVGWCSQRLGTLPTALHHCAWSLVTLVQLWGPLGGPLCQWPCYHHWIARGMCKEALDLERSNGGERTESKCRKDEDIDLWYRPGPLAEFRQVSMCCLCTGVGSNSMCTGVGSNSIFCNSCK